MQFVIEYWIFVLAGAVLGSTFIVPETLPAVFLGITFCFILLHIVETREKLLRGFLLLSVVAHPVGFHWLVRTLSFFGGFPDWVSYLLFAAFVLLFSLQFVFCAWLYKRLRSTQLKPLGLALPLSWLASEFLFPRMFPWHLAHSQIVWSSFSGMAEIFGVSFLSFILLFWCNWLWDLLRGELTSKRRERLIMLATSLLLLGYGGVRNWHIKELLEFKKPFLVASIQGNLTAKRGGDELDLRADIGRYQQLTRKLEKQGAQFVVWPEAVQLSWTREDLQTLKDSAADPSPYSKVPLMYGLLTARERTVAEREALESELLEAPTPRYQSFLGMVRHNSTFVRAEDGTVIGRYHKRALMPFGEYIPFASKFPSILELSPQSATFDRGKNLDPIRVTLPSAGDDYFSGAVNVMPLICYEDLVPALSRDAVRRGANVLVNLTNDVWYGDTIAPHQHHLLALWRAIETRRYLLRVTNTGVTAVVDPFGQTVERLPVFQEGALLSKLHSMEISTPYVTWGDLPLWLLSLLTLLGAIRSGRKEGQESGKRA